MNPAALAECVWATRWFCGRGSVDQTVEATPTTQACMAATRPSEQIPQQAQPAATQQATTPCRTMLPAGKSMHAGPAGCGHALGPSQQGSSVHTTAKLDANPRKSSERVASSETGTYICLCPWHQHNLAGSQHTHLAALHAAGWKPLKRCSLLLAA